MNRAVICKMQSAFVIACFFGLQAQASNVTVLHSKPHIKNGNEDLKQESDLAGAKNSPEKYIELSKDHSLLLPALVPFKDELTINGLAEFNKEKVELLEKKAVLLKKDCRANSLGLYRGRVLFDCDNDVSVLTPDAKIRIARGSIVYVYSTGESLVVLNLHDDKRRAVLVTVQDKEFELPPGRELLVTHYGNLKFDEARLCPGVWYRTVQELLNAGSLKVYQTQFSTISAAAIFPAVHKLAQGKKGMKLAKTFAAVITVSRDRQPFRPHCDNEEKPRTAVVSVK